MADIPPNIPPVDATDVEIAQDKPVTESLFTKIAANQNRLIDLSARNIKLVQFTASGSWTVPTTITDVNYIWVWGAGGGGGGGGGGGQNTVGAAGAAGGAGGNGAQPEIRMLSVFPGGNVTITIGAGGTGGAAGISGATATAGANGTAGGNTYVRDDTSGNLIYFGGGFGGQGGQPNPSPSVNAPAGGTNRVGTSWDVNDVREDLVSGVKGSWNTRGGDGGIVNVDSEGGADGWTITSGTESGGTNASSGTAGSGGGAGGGGGGGFGGFGDLGRGGTGGAGNTGTGTRNGSPANVYAGGGGGGAGAGSAFASGVGGIGAGGRVIIFYYGTL